jgi:hypothetical protein
VPQHPLSRRLGGPQGQLGRWAIAMATELSQLHIDVVIFY